MTLSALPALPHVRRLFARDPARQLQLVAAAWRVAVGAELQRRTRPEALLDGTLRVRVPDAQWRKALHRMQPAVVQALRVLLGEQAPRRLSFVEGALGETAPEAAAWDPPEPQPLPDALRQAAAGIPDPELRALFEQSAARALARRPQA